MTSARKPKKPARPVGRVGAPARTEAMLRLAEGETATSIARSLGVDPQTVRGWRRRPDEEAQLRAATDAREAALRSTLADARERIAANLIGAVEVALDVMRSASRPADKLKACFGVMDRGGLPRIQRVEVDPPSTDTSRLSDEELATYERLLRKIGETA